MRRNTFAFIAVFTHGFYPSHTVAESCCRAVFWLSGAGCEGSGSGRRLSPEMMQCNCRLYSLEPISISCAPFARGQTALNRGSAKRLDECRAAPAGAHKREAVSGLWQHGVKRKANEAMRLQHGESCQTEQRSVQRKPSKVKPSFRWGFILRHMQGLPSALAYLVTCLDLADVVCKAKRAAHGYLITCDGVRSTATNEGRALGS